MGRFVDLSVTVDSSTMSPPSTNMRLEVTPHNRGPGFWQVSSVHQSLHTGAHIDSPLHVFKNGITTAEISLDQVMGEALVVDLSWVGANHAITIDDLKNAGAGDVKRGDIVLLRTDWTDKMYGTWPGYFTQSPYFPPESAQWLVDRGPKNIGFDFFEEYCARLADFTSEDFAMHHPGGALGRRLLVHVRDIMHTGAKLPRVGVAATLAEAILEMSAKGLGMTAVVEASGALAGLFTDGDLRRTLEKHDSIKLLKIADVMTRNPRTISPDKLAAEAAQLMQAHQISGRLLVIDAKGGLVGAITFNDLLAAGVI